MNRWAAGTGLVALAGAAALVVGGCPKRQAAAPAVGTQQAVGRPECPAREDSIIIIDSMRERHAFPQSQLAGPTHNTPEYHDCQRLLAGTSDAYGPLVGVWAAYPVAGRFADIWSSDTAVAVAELFNWGDPYDLLGIGRYFNCLYMRRTGDSLVAEMVPVGLDNMGCLKSRSLWYNARTLHVERERLHEFPPPVARWEWSPTGTQYIGIACGTDWCRVGPDGFRRDSVHAGSEVGDVPQAVAINPGARLRVAGWYDEQRLAPAVGVPTRATDVRAIVVPHERLGQYGYRDFEGQWAPVAFIRFETGSGAAPTKRPVRLGYATKFGYARGDTTSILWLCRGLAGCLHSEAGADSLLGFLPGVFRPVRPVSAREIALGANPNVPNRWWAKITVGSSERIRPVIRCDHSADSIPVPGTARWRWTLDDERVWVRCVNGCCEVR